LPFALLDAAHLVYGRAGVADDIVLSNVMRALGRFSVTPSDESRRHVDAPAATAAGTR
jgi:hypothetical protein